MVYALRDRDLSGSIFNSRRRQHPYCRYDPSSRPVAWAILGEMGGKRSTLSKTETELRASTLNPSIANQNDEYTEIFYKIFLIPLYPTRDVGVKPCSSSSPFCVLTPDLLRPFLSRILVRILRF